MGSLEGGAWELRLRRWGVPLTERRFERREAGDDDDMVVLFDGVGFCLRGRRTAVTLFESGQ